MYDNRMTRNQWGWANTNDTDIMSDFPLGDWTGIHNYFNDYDVYNASDFTVTKVGTGTNAGVAADGGVIQVVNSAAGADSVSHKLGFASFKLATGLRCWGRFMFSVDHVNANFIVGLHNSTTTPFAAITDGIVFQNASGGTLSVKAYASSSATTATLTQTLNPGLTNMINFAFYYEGNVYGRNPNGTLVYQITGAGISANVRGSLALPSTFPQTTLLNPAFAVQNNTAAARTMNMDLIDVANERTSILATPPY